MTYLEKVQAKSRAARVKAKNRKARRPALGSRHTITEVAYKDWHGSKSQWHVCDISDSNHSRGRLVYKGSESPPPKKGWFSEGWEWEPDPPITSYNAMYIGYRYKFNGFWDSQGPYGEESYFVQTETVEVWLFVTHDNRNPVFVKPFDYIEDEDKQE